VLSAGLALADDVTEGTLEKGLGQSDLELAIEGLSGRRRR
jgi:hypothetical protein